MSEKNNKITIKNAKVVFFNPEDDGFGTSITIECTPEIQEQIESWYKENNIGKDNPGVPKFKEYTAEGKDTVIQFAFKITDKTNYAGINGLGKDNLGYGAVVDLIARAFEYNNKFTAGKTKVGQSVSAVVIRSGASSGGEADLAELLGDVEDTEEEEEVKVSDIPF